MCAACLTPRLNLSSELSPSWNDIQDTFLIGSKPDTTSEFWFSLHPSTTSAYVGCSPWLWMNLLWNDFLSQRATYLCQWWWCQNRPTMLLEQRVCYSHHFKIFITKSISWKLPNTRILKPNWNILHEKWNWICCSDYTCEVMDTDFFFSPSIDHHPVILCNSIFF